MEATLTFARGAPENGGHIMASFFAPHSNNPWVLHTWGENGGQKMATISCLIWNSKVGRNDGGERLSQASQGSEKGNLYE